MTILFQNTLFFKEFLTCKGCFGLSTKIKKGSGSSFWFFHKNVPYLIPYLSIDKDSMSYISSFSRYQTKCAIKFLIKQLMMSQTLRVIFDHHLNILWSNGQPAPWWSGYHYCTTSFNKAWTQVLRKFKSSSRRIGHSRWWGSLTMVPARNAVKRLSWVNHTTKKFIIITGKKGGEDGDIKMWISQEEKELFRWNKKHISYLFKGNHLVKNEIQWTHTLKLIPTFLGFELGNSRSPPTNPVNIDLFKVDNRNTKAICEISSKLKH